MKKAGILNVSIHLCVVTLEVSLNCTFRSVRLSGLEVYFILYIYIFFFPKELDHTHTVRGRASLKKSGLQLLTVTEVNLTFSILVLYCNVMYDKANFSVRFSMDNSEIKREVRI